MFFKSESYQGASKYIYPYGLNDVISNEKEDHAWKTLVLENEYIKLCVTPEIGGKLDYATDITLFLIHIHFYTGLMWLPIPIKTTR